MVLLEDGGKPFGVLIAHGLYSKVIDDETKQNRTPFVVPETWHRGCLVISSFFKMLTKLRVGQDAGLWQVVHALCDIEVYPTIFGILEVVLVDEFLGDFGEFDFDVLMPVHRGAEVEILDVKACKTRPLAREDTIDGKFESFGAEGAYLRQK